MSNSITDQMIRETAYYLWEKAGRPEGTGEEFWIMACEQLLVQKKESKPKKSTVKKAKKTTKK